MSLRGFRGSFSRAGLAFMGAFPNSPIRYLSPVDEKRLAALEMARGLPATPNSIERVAAATSAEAARWAFTQWELRRRARAKFERADEMLFDREGLEMASHSVVARYHASQFPRSVRVADLTCGIGSDLIEIAGRGGAVGFEVDPHRAGLVRHNLTVHGLESEVRVRDCLDAEWDFQYAFADPARRESGRRTPRHPEEYRPALSTLLQRMESLRLACVKLSPMLPDAYLRAFASRLEFVSHGGECCEALLFLGEDLALPDGRSDASVSAVHALTGETLEAGASSVSPPQDYSLEFFLEADPAAIRAHALGSLCSAFQMSPLGESNGYLTANALASGVGRSPWLRAYRAVSFGNADAKRIRADLKLNDAYLAAVKVRGVKESPTKWQAKFGAEGARPLVLALYPVGRGLRYALVEPVSSGTAPDSDESPKNP